MQVRSALDVYLQLGETITLGRHVFTAGEIKEFAAKYDPQPFHTDEAAAKTSVFGGLCASGWHTCALWMRYNLENRERTVSEWSGPGPQPEFGPSPGFSDLKWLKPVYAGDAITFRRTALSHRPLASRPGWHVLSIRADALNGDGHTVLEMTNAALFQMK